MGTWRGRNCVQLKCVPENKWAWALEEESCLRLLSIQGACGEVNLLLLLVMLFPVV